MGSYSPIIIPTLNLYRFFNNSSLCFLISSSTLETENKLLRGCLSKNHPLNLAQKLILPGTLATERLYQG